MTEKILQEQELVSKLRHHRNDFGKIVFTNGCFDLLHPGHVDYLYAAKALGDSLIIGINDDASVRGLKGENRPINQLSDRMVILAALACSDIVVPFSEATPKLLIESISPDILVKGGDYTIDTIVGATHVKSYGGEVIVIPFKEGYSSTKLIQKIKNA